MKILKLFVKNTEIPVVYESSKTLGIANLRLVFKAAGDIEAKSAGLANFAANILNEGTKKQGAIKFAAELETRAIALSANTGRESFVIEIDCLKEHFSFALKKLKQMLDDPNLSEESLKKLKTIILGEISNKQNDFDYLARIGLIKTLYPNSKFAYPSLGNEKSVKAITLDDIKDFLHTHLDLSNLMIVFGGDVKPQDLDELKLVLESLPVGKKRTLSTMLASDKCKTSYIKKQSEQAYIYFGSPYLVDEDERYKVIVAMFILGAGGFGSRLLEEIRVKRGLAYGAYANASFNLSTSLSLGYLQTKNESKDEAVGLVNEEFIKFVKNGVSEFELAQAKKFLLGSLPLRLETLGKRLAIAQSEFYRGKKLGSFLNELKLMEKLKTKDLNDFIAKHDEITKLSFCVLFNEI
ncbi:MAG: insulinase family protein [Campylobacter sp.]|nr:insulinase family protein [Campylobacter sp.]